MTKTIETLDQKLRERALKKASEQLGVLTNKYLKDVCEVTRCHRAKWTSTLGVAASDLESFLHGMHEAIMEAAAKDLGDATVEDFMRDVANLQEEVEELKDRMESV